MKRFLPMSVFFAAAAGFFGGGCGTSGPDYGMLDIEASKSKYTENDEQYLNMMAFTEETRQQRYSGSVVNPEARDKRLRKIFKRLQSRWATEISDAEADFYSLADPTRFRADSLKIRKDAIYDLVDLLNNPRAETRAAAARMIVKCYSSRNERRYIWHVIDKIEDPVPYVRFAAWYALTDKYGTITGNPYNVKSGKTLKRFADRWIEWYRKGIDPEYEGDLPKRS